LAVIKQIIQYQLKTNLLTQFKNHNYERN